MIASDSMRRFRRWYQNYQAKHGTAPPRDLVSDFIRGEREAEISRSNQARALGLQEERMDIMKDQQRANERAATISGVSQLGVLGVVGGTEIYDRWPKRTLEPVGTTQPATAATAAPLTGGPSGTVANPNALSGTGMGYPAAYTPQTSSGLSTTAPTGTTTASTTQGGLGTTGGGMNVYGRVGLGVAAAGLGAEHQRWGRQWHREQFGKSGERMSNVAARTGQGALIGASFGGGYGAAVGAGVGFVYGMEEEYHVTENVFDEVKGWFS